jgi:hypothetical protein
MKTNLKLALFALVIGLSITGCNHSKKDKLQPAAAVESVDFITGDIRIADGKIKVHIDARVASDDFKVQGYQIINCMEFKGIAFRYQNTKRPYGLPDDGVDYTMSYEFTIDENSTDQDGDTLKWKAGDSIRIMLINDTKNNVLKKLKPYFYSRMIYFGKENATTEELNTFNIGWNENNNTLQVRNFTPIKKPRLAKGDIILGIQ